MKKIAALLGAGLVAGSLNANAQEYAWGPHDPIEFGVGLVLTGLDGPKAFLDTWFFALAPNQEITSVSLTTSTNGTILNILNGHYGLTFLGQDGLPGTEPADGAIKDWDFNTGEHHPVDLGPGFYMYTVSGVANGSAGGLYTLVSTVADIPAPVPVPAPALLLGSALAGLGLMRRKREA